MVMMMFMSCYTIVDGIFISRYLGSEALSAANIVYPVFNLLLAVGIMFATGGSAVVSKKLGEGKKEEAMEDFSFLTAVGVALSVLLMIATLLFHNQISLFLGSSERILDYCNAYLIYLVLFAPACMLQSLYQSFFVTAGKLRLGLVLTVIAGLANAFFDYFFLAVCGMEIEGAAIATGIGQMIPAVVGTVYFFFFKGELHFVPFHFHGATLKQSCFNGSSEMVSNLANAIITYLFNIILMRIAGENGVAAITIILYAQFLFNSLYLGFSIICGTVIGCICGFVGAGGGMMMLLILTSVLGYELKTAVGTSVFIMTFTALTGALSHFAIGGTPDLVVLILCIVSTLIFARVAAVLANKAPAKLLNQATGVILVILGAAIIAVQYVF